MDFARRQLEKYGWSNGKGLGKNENGISEALKPKLKRSVTGIGHDGAAEFNDHWWSALYDKAAKNVEVEEKNGKTKKIKTVDNFTITNSTWKINKKSKSEDNGSEYSGYFIKKATLTNDGTKLESENSDSEVEGEKKDVFQMTDEELFKACEGRTAHKGARHGLKALGKLKRIAEQEQKLLVQTKYQGYSHAKKLQKSDEEIVENTSVADIKQEKNPKSKKKKKKKWCSSNENCDQAESEDVAMPNENLKSINGDTSYVNKDGCGRKSRKSDGVETEVESSCKEEKKSKKKQKNKLEDESQIANESIEESIDVPKKKKKKDRTDGDA